MTQSSSVPRVAFIGAGRMARDFHLPSQHALAAKGRSRLVAICDVNGEQAAKTAREFGVPAVYLDIDEMLRAERPDGVVVIVPVPLTARVASAVLKQGIPVMMEKPPGYSPRECRAIAAASKQGRAPSMVAFNRRRCPVIVQGRAEILKRGAVKGASARMYRHRRAEEEFFFGTGIHALDALRFIAGDIELVETERRPVAKGERPVFQLRIGYKNGGAGTYSVRPEAGVQLERYEIFGAESTAFVHAGVGWLVDAPGTCTLYEKNKLVKLPDPLREWAKAKDAALRSAISGGFYGENEAFVAALSGKGKFTPSAEESIESVEIADAVRAGRNWKRKR
jgi:myo-inositol 2-dehydrogenase/D-chiro-inositol 1-dehydrogenase